MDNELLGFLIVVFSASMPLIVLGYLIAFKKKYGLISGWDSSKFKDPESAASLLGKSFIGMGIFTFIGTFLWWQNIVPNDALFFVCLPAVAVPIIAVMYINKHYGKNDL